MTITLKNYNKELAKELLQAAEKSKVRECDETEKGVYVAYVDEGGDTFDVSLTILPNGKLSKSNCDCPKGTTFCRHKVALLVHVAKGKKVTADPKIKKKESKAETLLEQADFITLKEWVKSLIQKNKDVELSFVSHFSDQKQYRTPDEVIKLIDDALKAAGCNKRKADASQVKKLVELFTEVLQPVVQYYQANVTDAKAFQSFHALVEQCFYLHSSIHTGVRILRYVEDVLQQAEPALNNLQHEESWLLAADHLMQHLADTPGPIRVHYATLLKNMIDAADESKRVKLIGRLTKQFKMLSSVARLNWAPYAKIILGIVKSNNLFRENYKIFKPLVFENQFNLELIGLLIDMNQLELARQYSKAQIVSNYQREYNVPYLEFLKTIYTIEGDEANVTATVKELFPSTFNFDDYLFIIKGMNAEEVKKWRTNVLARARSAASSNNYQATEFCFKLMAHEKNYRKMVEIVNSYTPYTLILKYFELMVATEKQRLIDAIIRKSDNYGYSSKYQDDELCFPALFDLTEKHYSADGLSILVKEFEKGQTYYNRPNRFVMYIKKRLGE